MINLKTAKALIAEATIIIEHLGLHHPGTQRLAVLFSRLVSVTPKILTHNSTKTRGSEVGGYAL